MTIKPNQKQGLYGPIPTNVLRIYKCQSFTRFLSMIAYPFHHCQLFCSIFKEMLLTTTTLLLLGCSVKVVKSTSSFISYTLFWGHGSCRHPGFKLRLSISTKLSVLVVTICRGQRSHLGHSFSVQTFFHIFHWGQFHEGFLSSQGLCVPSKAALALSQTLGSSLGTNMVPS